MEVAKALAQDQYEKFAKRRLSEESEREALEDDAELERMSKILEHKPRKRKKH